MQVPSSTPRNKLRCTRQAKQSRQGFSAVALSLVGALNALSCRCYSSTARVYNLRLLLLVNIGYVVDLGRGGNAGPTIAYCLGMVLHHILVIFTWRVDGRAVMELFLILLEMRVAMFLAIQELGAYFLPQILVLLLSGVFRSATMIRSKEPFFHQRFSFLGECSPASPPYTPLAILLNRSILKPLVRGESIIVVFSRAVILNCIAVGVPAFAIYSIFMVPVRSERYIRTLVTDLTRSDLPGNVTFYLCDKQTQQEPRDHQLVTTDVVNVSTGIGEDTQDVGCQIYSAGYSLAVECPTPWKSVEYYVSISVNVTAGIGWVYVYVQNGLGFTDQEPLMLLPGSQLFGLLTWTERRLLSGGAFSRPYFSLFIPEVSGLVNNAGAGIATLTLVNRSPTVMKLIQETVDDTPLSGIATFGGFWSFLNGAFAIIFGANIVYFLFGEFLALEERWHADFPALHSEGGLPGSESAGIVAFIRERLVDVGQDPRQKANSQPDLTEDGTEETVEVDLPTDNSRDENEKLVSPDTPPSRSQRHRSTDTTQPNAFRVVGGSVEPSANKYAVGAEREKY
ncbi:hypothetical protein B0H13DRAFT_2567873 [Mycena leptocephala]|nr:hypothetical protein B0H13DRAFT_2567873 [Mycena leptocephala]